MIKVASQTNAQPLKDIPCVVSPTSYKNDTLGHEQLLIDGGVGVELHIDDGLGGGGVVLRNTSTIILRPFSSVVISYTLPPNAVKVMVL